jgi:putative nucleotidyltransferase with HDIG domain
MSFIMDRASAFALVSEYTKNPALVNHMRAVELAMRAYARKLNEDEEKWGIVGLLHDFDYERWPDPPNHPLKGSEILKEQGYPEDVIYAIKALYACDELCGFVIAAALVRPGGIVDMSASSVKKKLKAKQFARNVKREDIDRGAADFGVDLTEHIQFVIDALKPQAEELGVLKGSGAEEG